MFYKKIKVSSFFKIWVCHFFVYYLIQAILLLIDISSKYEENIKMSKIFSALLGSILIGLFGFLDGIGFFGLIAIPLMWIIKLKIKKFLLSYLFSILVIYTFFLLIFNSGFGYSSRKNIIISLMITVLINCIIFRQHKQIK